MMALVTNAMTTVAHHRVATMAPTAALAALPPLELQEVIGKPPQTIFGLKQPSPGFVDVVARSSDPLPI